MQKGYEIIDIFDVHEYAVTHYNSQTGQGGHFVEYIHTLLKFKTEAGGYPDGDRTPEDDDQYIDNFFASERIRLDNETIRLNATKRGLTKLCLYSMWGKLIESYKREKSKMTSHHYELYMFVATTVIEVTKLIFA